MVHQRHQRSTAVMLYDRGIIPIVLQDRQGGQIPGHPLSPLDRLRSECPDLTSSVRLEERDARLHWVVGRVHYPYARVIAVLEAALSEQEGKEHALGASTELSAVRFFAVASL